VVSVNSGKINQPPEISHSPTSSHAVEKPVTRRKASKQESEQVFRHVQELIESGALGPAEVLQKPIKAVDGEWYTPQEFQEKFDRGDFEKFLSL
jgi:hypothetical protein